MISKRMRELWIEEFAKHGNMAAACRVVGCQKQGIKALVERNRFFARRVDEAKEHAVGRLEKEAYRRAVEGTANYVVSDGRVVRYKGKPLVKREYSDSLMSLLLRAHGGEAYRVKTDQNIHHEVDGSDVARKLADALARKFGNVTRAGKKGGVA